MRICLENKVADQFAPTKSLPLVLVLPLSQGPKAKSQWLGFPSLITNSPMTHVINHLLVAPSTLALSSRLRSNSNEVLAVKEFTLNRCPA